MADRAAAGPLRVLIADDSRPIAEMLTELISERGRVEVVGVGESEAGVMEAIRTLRPDVVILDLQLATGSGTDVIRAVRADPALAPTCLLVTSNHVSAPMKAGCIDLGADDFYDKVKEIDALARRIGAIADARQEAPG
jgi:DNA-binding NarL/FixJ family response regulator